ncbi:MAG: nuclear transport factor 2 family protein [Chitinispirillaceae bacterium]
MGEAQNIGILKNAYALLDKDDYDGFVEMCTSDAVWLYPVIKHIPYSGRWIGRQQISRFLKLHNEVEEVIDFRPGEFLAQGNRVAVPGFYRGHVISNGRVWDSNFVHLVTLKEGRIDRYEAFFDTAAAMDAHEP